MNRSTGYLLALCAGVSLGWLAQQFWFAGLDKRVSDSHRDLVRNEHRLKLLRDRQLKELAERKSRKLEPSEALTGEAESPEVLADLLLSKEILRESDFQSILKVADYKLAQNDFQGAIFYLYDLRLLIDYQYESAYLELIHEFVERLDLQFEEMVPDGQQVALFRQLVSLEPEFVPYYLSLTHWLIAAEEWDEAEQSLESAKFDITYSEEVDILAQMIVDMRDRSEQYVVPLKAVGEHYLVEMQVGESDNLVLMIDTGASMTVLKTSFVQDRLPSAMVDAEELVLKTANGKVLGSRIQIPSVALAGLLLNDVTVGVLPLDEFSHDGLLGMDILKRFEFKIDQENRQLILNPEA